MRPVNRPLVVGRPLFYCSGDIARAYNCLQLTCALARYLTLNIAGLVYVPLRAPLGWRPLPAIWAGMMTRIFGVIGVTQTQGDKFWRDLTDAVKIDRKRGIVNPIKGMIYRRGDAF